jgi:uroporphyrinogen III methyltransferase / synthase
VGESGSKPLAGKRVMVTRTAEQSETLLEALRAAGAEAVVVPLVAFAHADKLEELDRYLRAAGQYEWVFFTSQNAVRALEQRCAAQGRSLEQVLGQVKVAAVGPATADAVRAAGLGVTHISRVHNGVALAEELAEQVHGKRVFLPRSDRANPDLIEALQRQGALVLAVAAYKTVAPEAERGKMQELLARGGVDAVLFFSPSAVHHLRELVGAEKFRNFGRQAAFVAIGPVSARALKQEGVERVLTAADTTVAASIAALAGFFSRAGQAQPAGAKPR